MTVKNVNDAYMIDCTYSNQSVYVLVLVVSFAICTTTKVIVMRLVGASYANPTSTFQKSQIFSVLERKAHLRAC